jgi:uncharacterized protein
MKKKFAFLRAERIEKNLENLHQLTFEVTDACNLRCKYCGYGEYYDGYDKREDKFLSISKAIAVLEYMVDKWSSKYSSSYKKNTYISFYGGEPLMNMGFIRDVVEWISNKDIPHCHFVFTMTTNALLLKRHIDFLVESDFKILVSLDGDKHSNSYRVDKQGENSFDRIMDNLAYVKEKYPDFFSKNISFNSVLNGRSSHDGIVHFFKETFDKVPTIAEINPMNIKSDRIEEFSKVFKSKTESISQSVNKKELQLELFMGDPQIDALCTYIHWHSGNVFKTYNDLLTLDENKSWIPTGTCLPFEKKMFVTVNGKILPCERISHEYALGGIENGKVALDFEDIAKKYNAWYEQYIPQCNDCYAVNTCKQCMFYNPHLNTTCECPYIMNKDEFARYQGNHYAFLADNSHLYREIMEKVIIH